MLFGRQRECGVLDRLLVDAQQGHSGVVALSGEPGIGKTALLEYAVERAVGMRLLRASGVESESMVPFAGLLELLRPALGITGKLPAPQAAALGTALAFRPASAHDRFAVGAATLSLLAAYAEEGPLLLVVDDVHWLDGSSAEALVFALRRLVADPVAAVVAVRAGESSILDVADLPELRINGIDRQACWDLLAADGKSMLSDEIVSRLHEMTAGNPLALLEMSADVNRRGAQPTQDLGPVSLRAGRAFVGRFRALPEPSRRMLLLAAASGNADSVTLTKAADVLQLDLADLAAAEAVGLLSLEAGRVTFRHPLVRSAVYHDAAPDWRREAHKALAEVLPEAESDRRAWHLASAAIGPDPTACQALVDAGRKAWERSAYSESTAAFERAARLASEAGQRDSLLLAAADAAWIAGLTDRAGALAEELRGHHPQPPVAARVNHLRGQLAMRRGPVMKGQAILAAAAEQAAAAGLGQLAVAMLADAANACFYAGDCAELAKIAGRVADMVPEPPDPTSRFLSLMVAGMASVLAGTVNPGAGAIRSAVAIYEESADLTADVRLLPWAVVGTLWIREADTGATLVDRALATARERSAIGTLPYLLHHVARHQATSDQWPMAVANYHEAMQLARETARRTDLAAALAGLAWVEARQGNPDARAHAQQARSLCQELGAGIYDLWALAAQADLELGLSHPAAALVHLTEYRDKLNSLQITDADLSPAPELVEVQLRLGDRQAATSAAHEISRQAAAKQQPWALARAARCQGLLASEATFPYHFQAALDLHAQTPDAFEAARTRLAYGSRLRRSRHRVAARVQLRHALEIFERLGASPWADLAAAELAATGETARRRDPSTVDQLTPQELQIAVLLARGGTTREVAAALFLSPKTIEYHTGRLYRKLRIRSRRELAAALESRE